MRSLSSVESNGINCSGDAIGDDGAPGGRRDLGLRVKSCFTLWNFLSGGRGQ